MNLGTEILTIPTAQIHKDDVFNCRPRSEITNDNEIPAMGKEFEAGKQIAPVIVWNREDVQKNAPELIKGMGDLPWFLVSGYRRDAAATMVNVPLRAIEFKGTLAEAEAVNLGENTGRRDLKPAALANRFFSMNERGMGAGAIAAAIGKPKEAGQNGDGASKAWSKGYIVNLIFIRRHLSPELWAHFENGHPFATTDRMRQIAALPKEAQIEKWNEITGQATPGGDQNPDPANPTRGGKPAKADKGPKRLNEKRMKEFHKQIADQIKATERMRPPPIDLDKLHAVEHAIRVCLGVGKRFELDGTVLFDAKEKPAKDGDQKATKDAQKPAKAAKAPKAAPKADKGGKPTKAAKASKGKAK